MSDRPATAPLPEEDFGIKILKNGTWLHKGRPIVRQNLVKLFASVLRRDESGDFWLQTPAERGRIEVEDAPFMAVELRRDGAGCGQMLHFRTNVDDWVALDAAHALYLRAAPETGMLEPYIHIRGGLEAKIARSVYYELAALVENAPADEHLYGVYSGGVFFPLMPPEA